MKCKAPHTDFYVYALLREDMITPFYIGKGRKGRVNCHEKDALAGKKSHRLNVARKVIAECGRIPYEIMHAGLSEQDAFFMESYYITMLGRENNRSGILTNATDGGEGTSGRIKSEEEREKTRLRNIRRFSDATAREAIAQKNKELWSDPDHKAKRSAGIAAAKRTPEYRARQAEMNKKRWEDPEYRMRHSLSNRISQNDPAIKAVQAQKRRERWADPEFKARMSKAISEGMARKKQRSEEALENEV